MQSFIFSEGEDGGHLALHVLCAWHLVERGTLVTGSGDLKQPVARVHPTSSFDWESFDWHPQGANLRDARVEDVLGRHPDGLAVVTVDVDAIGHLRLDLAPDVRLELFPSETVSYYDEAEHWRLLRLDAQRRPTEDPHLVMTAEGAYEV